MLTNSLSMLVYSSKHLGDRLEKPVAYMHRYVDGETYQIIIQRIPKQDTKAA